MFNLRLRAFLSSPAAIDTDKEEFRSHAESFFRFTYRRDFPALEPYPITSDAGWGCMLRAAQMLMGYALRKHYLGSGMLDYNSFFLIFFI